MSVRDTMRKPWCLTLIMVYAVCNRIDAAPAATAQDVLSAAERQKVDRAVERGLEWLYKHQERDGSFPTADSGEPAVTAICLLAFLASGHVPGQGK